MYKVTAQNHRSLPRVARGGRGDASGGGVPTTRTSFRRGTYYSYEEGSSRNVADSRSGGGRLLIASTAYSAGAYWFRVRRTHFPNLTWRKDPQEIEGSLKLAPSPVFPPSASIEQHDSCCPTSSKRAEGSSSVLARTIALPATSNLMFDLDCYTPPKSNNEIEFESAYVIRALCLYLRPQFRHGGKSKGKGGRPARGRVPGRTCRRSYCCGFAEVLGFFRAELYKINTGLGELNMTAWSFRTRLTKWDPVTRSNSWDIDWNI